MSRDYKSPSKSASGKKGPTLLLGLFIGYVLGLVSAIGVWIYIHQAPSPFILSDKPEVSTATKSPNNGALKGTQVSDNEHKSTKTTNGKPRFEFYKILPGSEEPVTEQQFQKAVQQPSSKDKYYLQAGSFQNAEDAENLKAKIAMLGMQAYVQSADLSEKGMWHRVRIGPFTKIVDINQARSSLLKSDIDANLIKVHGGTQ
ncbi:MAG: SPOR domain-containing protein [Nitrosomonadaceae bacterium]|jgi:cell division protein FtsN